MRTRWVRAALLLCMAASGLGCNSILGIHDLRDDDTAAGDASVADAAPPGANEAGARDAADAGSRDGGGDGGEGGLDATREASIEGGEAEGGKEAGEPADAGGCGLGQQLCDGACASMASLRTCGTCSNDCTALPHVSLSGLTCNAGRCGYTCGAGFADCDAGGGCATSLAQNTSCGACGSTCAAPTTCSESDGGAYGCASTCGGGTPTLCNSHCINEQADNANCGGCGASYACATGQTCISGICKMQLSASVPTIAATVGQAFSGAVGVVTDSIASDAPSAIAAVIAWGDGTTSAGTVTGSAGSFTVTGAHTYASPGTVTLGLTVSDSATAASVTAKGSATVQCSSVTLACGATCVTNSNSNCGSCGTTCSAGSLCSANGAGPYSCVSTCSGATPDYCGGQCINEATNPSPNAPNCGGCGASYACTGGTTCQGGRCNCPTGWSTCGGSTCINLEASDANNCGACAHSCLGGACSAGACQPDLFVISGDLLQTLWVDSTAVYAGGQSRGGSGLFDSFDKSTGAQLGNSGGYGYSTPITASTAYFAQTGFPSPTSYWSIFAYTLPTLAAGSPAAPYTQMSANASSNPPVSVAASQNTLVWVDGKGGLYAGSTAGAAFQTLSIVETSTAGSIVVSDASGFVWTEASGGFRAASPSTLTTPVTIATSPSTPASQACVVLDANNIYWFDQSAGALYRTSRGGASLTVLMASPVHASQLAIYGSNLYWADPTPAVIYSVPANVTTITTPTVVASGFLSPTGSPPTPTPSGVAVDNVAYYWSAQLGQGNYIYRLAK